MKLNDYPKEYILLAIDEKLEKEYLRKINEELSLYTIEQLADMKRQLLSVEVSVVQGKKIEVIRKRGGGRS